MTEQTAEANTTPQDRFVAVVDDDASVRSGLEYLLESVGMPSKLYESGDEFLERGADAPGIGCILLDVRMPGTNGLDVLGMLGRRVETAPVVILTGHADVPMAVRAMKSGAFDFIEKPFNQQLLLDRVQAAFAAGLVKQNLAEHLTSIRGRFDTLTTREQEVFARVVEGLSNRLVAEELGITEKTVELHRSKVMRKMEASSLAELVRMSVTLETA